MFEVHKLVSWTESLCIQGYYSADSEIFLYLQVELKLLVAVVKGYRAALNHVFSLAGIDLAARRVISLLFHSFKRSCPPCEIRPPDWMVLRSLTPPAYDPLKLSSNNHPSWKTCFLLALVSAKRVNELYSLSFQVRHSLGWRACTFSFLPNFVGKTQNSSVPDDQFVEFSFRRWTTSWAVTESSFYSALSELFINTW